jgi:hypothetical protein
VFKTLLLWKPRGRSLCFQASSGFLAINFRFLGLCQPVEREEVPGVAAEAVGHEGKS